LLAVLLDRGLPLRTFLRSAFFFPFTLSVVTVGLIWLWLLDPVVGPFNYYLKTAGVPVWSWLADPSTAMWAIILTTVWWVTGYYLVIYLAGLQDIPPELYEAAAIDGASGLQRFRFITCPMLKGIYLISSLLSMVFTIGDFTNVWLLTGGAPGDSTHVLATLAYRYTFLMGKIDWGVGVFATALPVTLLFIFILIRKIR
jgi:multiple sugar transport system permease protein